jgi:hypothetical protein
MPSKVEIKTFDELEQMHTGSLMTRRKKLFACEESFSESDRYGIESEPDPDLTEYIEFKETEIWKKSSRELKSVLNTRENWPRK